MFCLTIKEINFLLIKIKIRKKFIFFSPHDIYIFYRSRKIVKLWNFNKIIIFEHSSNWKVLSTKALKSFYFFSSFFFPLRSNATLPLSLSSSSLDNPSPRGWKSSWASFIQWLSRQPVIQEFVRESVISALTARSTPFHLDSPMYFVHAP